MAAEKINQQNPGYRMPGEKSFPQGVWVFTRGPSQFIKGPIESSDHLMVTNIYG
jgi:hypothetical protein